jgi:hypothetical protein
MYTQKGDSRREVQAPRSSSSDLGTVIQRAAVAAVVFTLVSAVAGPVVGAGAAALAGGGSGDGG